MEGGGGWREGRGTEGRGSNLQISGEPFSILIGVFFKKNPRPRDPYLA
jgi:hypothetical protein